MVGKAVIKVESFLENKASQNSSSRFLIDRV